MKILNVIVMSKNLLLLLVLLLILIHSTKLEGFASDPQPDSIFVSVASYRDDECKGTLAEMYAKADSPGRVFVGACEQNKDALEACLPANFGFTDNVRVIRLPHTAAKGPTYARYLCTTLYRGETYFMQIDSHTKFVQGWDTKLIAMLKRCPAAKPVLTHYPHMWGTQVAGVTVPVMCKSKFNASGILTFEAVTQPIEKRPLTPVPFVAAGFMFLRGSALGEVPYDPDLPFLFEGEELLMTARLWTSGYDFFTPDENVVFHHYIRNEKPKFWNDIPNYKAVQAKTIEKVRGILGLTSQPVSSSYGLGNTRTIQAYWTFAGVDPANKTSRSEQMFCES